MALKVMYIGAFGLPTGYGEAARLHAKALAKVGVTVVARLNAPVPNNPEHPLFNELIRDEDQINEMMNPEITSEEGIQAAVWHVTSDAMGRIDGIPNFNYAAWEVEGLPSGWAQVLNERSDGLLTPSRFSARLFRESGVTKPIAVSPHPIDIERFNPEIGGALRQNLSEAKTVFLVVAQWMFRKGVEDTLLAYNAEFRRNEGTELLMVVWRKNHTFADKYAVKQQIKLIRESLNLPDYPRVRVIGQKLHPLAMPTVYNAVDVLVSTSRGEAFNLPIFEAAACGKPSISTGYGGMWDYLTDDMAYRLPYRMDTVFGAGPEWRHYNGTQKWARPSVDAIRKAMREAHEDSATRQAKGAAAMEMVMDRLTFPVAGRVMKEAIEQLMNERVA